MGLFDRFTRPDMNAKVQEAQTDPAGLILDVRTRAEYARGHVPGALNIPLDELDGVDERLADRHLYVHCQSGARSARAVELLKAQGHAQVENIGGINSYTGPVENE